MAEGDAGTVLSLTPTALGRKATPKQESALSNLLVRHRRTNGYIEWGTLVKDAKCDADLCTLGRKQIQHLAYRLMRRRRPGIPKPYVCAICSERFTTKLGLGMHRSKIHKPKAKTELVSGNLMATAASLLRKAPLPKERKANGFRFCPYCGHGLP